MTSLLSTKNPQVLRAIDEPRDLTNNISDGSSTLRQDVNNPRASSDRRYRQKTKHVLRDFGSSTHDRYNVTGPKSSMEKMSNRFSDSELAGPSISSPADSASAPSSPGAGSDIWDSPETPSYQAVRKSAIEVFTPLTPPTTYEVSVEQTSVLKASGSFVTKSATITDEITALIPHAGDEEDERKAAIQDEGYFKPKKLIRNLTKELQAISEATAAAAPLRYNLNPSFEFSPEPAKPTRSQRPSKTEKHSNAKVSHTGVLVKAESTVIKVESKVISRVRSPQTDLSRLLEHIIPLNIHTRLRSDPHKCVASLVNDPDEKCNNRVKGALNSVDTIFRNISKYNRKTDYSTLLDQIEKLVQAVMCGGHRNVALTNSKPNTRIAKLRKRISDLSSISREERSDLVTWITAISDPNFSLDAKDTTHHDGPTVMEPRTTSSHTPRATSTEAPKAGSASAVTTVPLSYSLKFVPYQPKWSARLSVSEALHSIITNPLKSTDEEDGFIYIFWDRAHFGMVKIGRTDNLERRLTEWNRKCKRVHSYHNASNRGESAKIPHVSRIERLIHIELKDRRMRRECEGCGVMHKEWFDVNETGAIKVLQKWRDWIVQKPYALDADSGEWRIRPDMLHTLAEVCEPVPLESAKQAPPKPRRQSGGGKGKRGKTPVRRTM